MQRIHLGFKAFDAHELACHFVARHAGLYATHGLEVRLLDTTFIPDAQLPPRTFQAACTAALSAWLQGAPVRVVFVSCDRPMFWLVGRISGSAAADAERLRIAGYPPGTPPDALLRRVLEAETDAARREALVLPARDDVARLGLLQGGDVDAAVVSSAVPHSRLAQHGIGTLRFFGDALRVPTTGLAVPRELQAREPALVRAMCACFRDGLRLLRTDAGLAQEAFLGSLDLSREEAAGMVEVVRRCYTPDGRSTAAIESTAIETMRQALGVDAPPAEPLYVPTLDP